MKYIFAAGAPGSKWSSVVKNIYFSADIDRSDASPDREYYHDASGSTQLMHMGAYWDPGMEFGNWFAFMDRYSDAQCEQEFNRPFSGQGRRIVKSHVFAHHIRRIKASWPTSPIILVHRSDDACLGWWVKCGHFDITYPRYNDYYQNLREMAGFIQRQNQDILQAWAEFPGFEPPDNLALAQCVGIAEPPEQYRQCYAEQDIRIKVI